jgi:outer membrane protein
MSTIEEYRMGRITGLAMAALLAGLTAVGLEAQQLPCQAPLRLAYINSQLILANTPGRTEAESLFAREMVGYRAQAQRLQQQIDSAVTEYRRTSVVLTPAARQARETEISNLQQRAQTRAQELDQEAQQREAQLTAPIMQRVNAVIEGVRAEFNCAMVFDAGAQGTTLVTADRALDLSPLVIQRLQAAGPAIAPAARDTTAAQPSAAPPAAQRPAARPPLQPQQPPPRPPARD